MSDSKQPISIDILGKRFTFTCQSDEVESLQKAAFYLNQKMREIRDTGRIFGIDRIAIMAALNMSHELLTERHHTLDYKEQLEAKVRLLSATLDDEI
jgi:cell division protein ZapA